MSEYVVLSHDAFARCELVRELIPAYDRAPCHWCGNAPGKFRYGVFPDDAASVWRIRWQTHKYCSVDCMRAIEGG